MKYLFKYDCNSIIKIGRPNVMSFVFDASFRCTTERNTHVPVSTSHTGLFGINCTRQTQMFINDQHKLIRECKGATQSVPSYLKELFIWSTDENRTSFQYQFLKIKIPAHNLTKQTSRSSRDSCRYNFGENQQ